MYPQEILKEVIERVWSGIESLGESVVGKYVIMNDEDGFRAEGRSAVRGKEIDAIIVNFVSWHITPYVMHVLQHFRGTPLLIWGIGGYHDATGSWYRRQRLGWSERDWYRYCARWDTHTKVICEKPDEALRLEEVKAYLRAVKAKKAVQNARIGLIGYADMGLYTCAYDKTLVFDKLGVDIEDYFLMINEMMKSMSAGKKYIK